LFKNNQNKSKTIKFILKTYKIIKNELLSDNWYILNKLTYETHYPDGSVTVQSREAYDRGNGATILLYNKTQKTVILTRQFRIPTYINGNETGYLIESCGGLLDKDNPEEETGYKISDVKKIFEVYMSPGSVTELIYFFVAEYSKDMKVSDGGGVEEESEDIEVLEIPFQQAVEMIKTGDIKDGKTIMLLQYAQIHNLI
jgi:nudix-type nucleoside diphosphatase (YffH/AdpP family)